MKRKELPERILTCRAILQCQQEQEAFKNIELGSIEKACLAHILLEQYEDGLNLALEAAKRLAEFGINHMWVDRTDLHPDQGTDLEVIKGNTYRKGYAGKLDDDLIGGRRIRLDVR